MGHAEALAPGLAVVVDIHPDDHVGTGEPQTLKYVEPDSAKPEYDRLGPLFDFGGVDHRADAGGNSAANVADLVEWRVVANLRDRDFGQHGEVGESRRAHVVVDRLAADRKPRAAVGHQTLALRGADCGAEIGLPRQT